MKNFIKGLKNHLIKKEVVEVQPVQTAGRVVEVMYEYRIKPGSENLPIPNNENNHCGDFCKKLLELDRLYTRVDIQNITAMFGYDVFKHCGGDGCIHEWFMKPVIRKNN